MSEEIGTLYKKLEKEVKDMYSSIQNKNKLMDLLRTQCDHKFVDAPEHYDYHKREDFVKCTYCGLVR